jgi:alkylation response protein AidB-like acyl-CoA dehydrogenase
MVQRHSLASAKGASMTYEDLLTIVRRVEPVIREHADRGERDRRVPTETADAFRAAGLFKTWVPKTLGGWEVEPVAACRIYEEIARVDSAAGWMLQMCSTISLLGAWLGDQGVAEMYERGVPVCGDSFAPPMRMQPVAGGWKVTGQAAFSSNCHHVDWFFGLGMEFEGGAPKAGPDGAPIAMTFAVPRGEFAIVDNWNTVGMRGTGSHDVRVDGVFVPERRVAVFHPIDAARSAAYRSPLARLGTIWLGITSMGAVGLGIARAAYDEFLELCGSKTPNYASSKVGEAPLTHYRLGEAHAHLGAGRSYLYGKLGGAWERVNRGEGLTGADRCDLAAASTFALQSAARALDLLGESAGTSMIRDENRLSRHFRDLKTLTQHVFTARNRYQDIGAMLLGRKPGFDMLGF